MFNFLGNKDPYSGMMPGMTDNEIAQLAGSGASNQMIANAQMGGMRDFAPVDKIVPNTMATPSPSGGMDMGKLGAGLSAAGSLLGGGEQAEDIQHAKFSPVPTYQAPQMQAPQYGQMNFDFNDYLRKRQMGIL